MESHFIWKGINSTDLGIMVTKLPDIERAAANIEKKTVPGRDGFLTIDDGTYQETVKSCECVLDNGNIDEVIAWLTGASDVIFSNEPEKTYKAVIINKIPFSKIIPTFHTFVIQFECQPHKYLDEGTEMITITAGATIYNLGTAPSEPILTVYGTGDITLTIGAKNIILKSVVSHVTINAEIEECYKDLLPKNNDMIGEWPIHLEVGANAISWLGTVTKIEIIPNWRNL